MIRARLWVADRLIAIARAIAGSSAPAEVEEEEAAFEFAAVIGPAAMQMLAEGEELAREQFEKERRAKALEVPAPLGGSLRARLEAARRNP